MRFLFVIGSPRRDKCTARALKECANTLETKGHECVFWNIPEIVDCTNCRFCKDRGFGL